MNDSDDESDVENNGHLLHLIFRKKHGQQLESIFADMVTQKQFILKQIVLKTVKKITWNFLKCLHKFFHGLEHKNVYMTEER